MGQTDNAFYLRCVDFETAFPASELSVLPTNLDKASIAIYRMLKVGDSIEGFLHWGLLNKTEGKGFYYSENEKTNVVVSVLKYLCWSEPNVEKTESDDDYDYGF